jgi:hypothetical protein
VGLRAGLDKEVTGKIRSPLPWIKPRSTGSPARSQTLYSLGYQAPTYVCVCVCAYIYIYIPVRYILYLIYRTFREFALKFSA